jgi:hypothetical protein
MSFMWADTLLAAERAHALRLLAWGAVSVLAGTALLAWLRVRAYRSHLLEQFAVQMAAWGTLVLLIAYVAQRGLALRDLAGATRLDRLLWLAIGLDAGFVLVGIALAAVGWRLGRRLGLIGAGTGIVVQGAALMVLDLVLAGQISR